MKLKKLEKRWKKASRDYTKLHRQEHQISRKASSAEFRLKQIEVCYIEEFRDSVKAEKPADKVVELTRLLNKNKIKFSVHRKMGKTGYGFEIPTYRITIRNKKSISKIKNLEGGLFEVKLLGLSDDYVPRPLQGTMTFVVYIYENHKEDTTLESENDQSYKQLSEGYHKLTPKGTIPA